MELRQNEQEKFVAKKTEKSGSPAYPNRAARKVPTDLETLETLVRRLDTCTAVIKGAVDAMKSRQWDTIEFDGANQGDRAVELLKKFAGNLGKAITGKQLDE